MLPTGTVSIRKWPVVAAPNDDTPFSESPVKASAPGRHWLDEPEDLGEPRHHPQPQETVFDLKQQLTDGEHSRQTLPLSVNFEKVCRGAAVCRGTDHGACRACRSSPSQRRSKGVILQVWSPRRRPLRP